MAGFAENVVLDLNQKRLFISGVEFPWFLVDLPSVAVLEGGQDGPVRAVTVTLFGDGVEVIPEDP